MAVRTRSILGAAMAATAVLTALIVPGGASAAPASPTRSATEPDLPYFTDTTGPSVAVKGDYATLVGHFTDLGLDDIFWYGYGSATESMWSPCPGCGTGPFTKRTLPPALQVNGLYSPIVGDFSGDEHDDIYWFNQDGADYLWTSLGDGTFATKRFDMAAGYWYPTLLPDSTYGPGKDDVLWQPEDPSTQGAMRLWVFPDDGSGVARTKGRPTRPQGAAHVGDFDGNGTADVFWYQGPSGCRCPVPSPEVVIDTYWRRASSESSSFTATTRNVKGSYTPIVGQFSGEGGTRDDILWYGEYIDYSYQTDGPDALWEGQANGSWTSSNLSIPHPYGRLLLERDEADTVLLIGSNPTQLWFDTTSGPVLRPIESSVKLDTYPVIGRFTTADRDDMFAYYPGTKAEHLYHPTA